MDSLSCEIDVAIIGAGVVGCAIAWKFSKSLKNKEIFVFEKNPGLTNGENQSTRNSGVIHSGIYYDPETRPLKALLCVEGNFRLYRFCEQYKVAAIKTGKLIVATNDDEEKVLELYAERARVNGVPGVEKIPNSVIRKLEPNVKARAALLVPTAGVVDAPSLTYRLYALASNNGVQFLTGTKVDSVQQDNGKILLSITYRDGETEEIRTRLLINAAGVEADRFARMLDPKLDYELDPVRGESYCFYGHKREEVRLFGMNIYPTPEVVETPFGRHFTVGIHLTPTFEDLAYPGRLGTTVLVGPRLVPVKGRDDWMGEPQPPSVFIERAARYFPGLREEDLVFHQMGIQARLRGMEDFVILADPKMPTAVHLLGIDSPGLTSCLAIAASVVEAIRWQW